MPDLTQDLHCPTLLELRHDDVAMVVSRDGAIHLTMPENKLKDSTITRQQLALCGFALVMQGN